MTQMATTHHNLVQLGNGQVGFVLDPATLTSLGLPAPTPRTTLSEELLLEKALAAKPRSKKTEDEYRRHYKELKAFLAEQCDGRTPLTATDDDLADFFDYMKSPARVAPDSTGRLRSHALSASKMRSVKAGLNAFYAMAQKRQQRYDNPVEDIITGRPKPKRGLVLTDEEVRKILKAPGDYPRCEVQAYLFHFTGARTESLRFLRREDVDYINNEIHLDRAKGDKAYTLPLHAELKAALLRWEDRQDEQAETNAALRAALADPDTAYVLLTYKGLPLCHSTMAKQYKWRAKRAGVRAHGLNAVVGVENKSKVSPHAARRTAGTSLRRNGVELVDVADFLNHSDLQTTREHYAFTSTPQKRKVMDKLTY